MSIKRKLLLTLFLAASIGSVNADEMNAGVVHFTGEIIDPTCVIDGNDGKDNNVPLGTYPSSLFQNPGDESSLIPFTISLKDCPVQSTGLINIQLTFEGTTVPTSNADLLAVSTITTGGTTAATNVAIAVSSINAITTLIKMDGSEDQLLVRLPTISGDAVSADLVARYRAVAVPVTAGPADADMTVNILYR
ncbi:type 1 fimbrial protein [Scandinavium sp. TWS1a]|uniref:fimbrial protein n=1 Tax=Scandinavium tedordense TaxID=2926521 RepID=UPI00216623F7|nr:fimbrial protein [Scandinavium tedordense]MCS2171604.1 type 1 fimbrial protein [Scandinavium tedordense]